MLESVTEENMLKFTIEQLREAVRHRRDKILNREMSEFAFWPDAKVINEIAVIEHHIRRRQRNTLGEPSDIDGFRPN